jgi:hypothetical protein
MATTHSRDQYSPKPVEANDNSVNPQPSTPAIMIQAVTPRTKIDVLSENGESNELQVPTADAMTQKNEPFTSFTPATQTSKTEAKSLRPTCSEGEQFESTVDFEDAEHQKLSLEFNHGTKSNDQEASRYRSESDVRQDTFNQKEGDCAEAYQSPTPKQGLKWSTNSEYSNQQPRIEYGKDSDGSDQQVRGQYHPNSYLLAYQCKRLNMVLIKPQ